MKEQNIGFDVDGVLANFVPAYQRAFVTMTGRDSFDPGDVFNPPCWDWPTARGYTKEETSRVWGAICADPFFWQNLRPVEDSIKTLELLVDHIEHHHNVYYITSRPGAHAKRQTEAWLRTWVRRYRVGLDTPTVMIVGHREKGNIAKALKLDIYVDDNLDNVNDCGLTSPATRTYLLDRSYNRAGMGEEELDPLVVRVATLGEMFDHEMGNL